jgi:hypothetical protein
MNEQVGDTAFGLLSGTIKVALTLGGLAGGVVGLSTGNATLVVIGVGMFILGQVVHALDQRSLDRQLQRWATEALRGRAPVPPTSVRMQLMRSVARSEGVRGDMKGGFQMACLAWAAADARMAVDDSARAWPTR